MILIFLCVIFVCYLVCDILEGVLKWSENCWWSENISFLFLYLLFFNIFTHNYTILYYTYKYNVRGKLE